MRYAEVAVDAPAGYDRTFTYSTPQSSEVLPGHLVEVPFGPRRIRGVVISLIAVPQVARTREIHGILEPEPLLSGSHLELARWISHYYMSPLFEAAALMLPPGGRMRPRTYLSLNPDIHDVDNLSLTQPQRKICQYVRTAGTVEQERLVRSLGEWARASVGRLVGRDIVIRSSRRGRLAVGRRYRSYLQLTSEGCEALPDSLLRASHPAPRQAALLACLRESGTRLDLAQARKEYSPSSVNGLLDKGWVVKDRVPLDRDPLAGLSFPESPRVILTEPQAAIAGDIRNALDQDSKVRPTFLIQGVTGSGKTEVYLDAVEHCLKLGKKAIVMVPEIALTHQTIERFATRLPGQVAVLHSGMSPGEQFDQWWKVKNGEYGVVIGSRSAIFAPQPKLGLIVIDEEHEWTYKQHDAGPRYHATNVALRVAELSHAVVVLGSASPDVGSYHKGLRGEYRLLELPQRFRPKAMDTPPARNDRRLASVQVVDMRRELREGNSGVFSRALGAAMDDCFASGGQMILFLNRRGSSAYVQCRSCGAGLRCRRCDISLTYHKDKDRLICHYCGYRRTVPSKCPSCLGHRLSRYGIGTQAVVDEVRARIPEAQVLRWDSDATKSAKAYRQLSNRFRSGEAQVLVGTQMIAKGLDFPSVTLVGVVSADVGLNIPDYRAGERAFQLLFQVAGRAGRGHLPGKVIVQTYQPENYAVQAAAAQDFKDLFRQELAFRRQQANPPFSKLIRMLYTHTNRARCESEAIRLAKLIRGQRDVWGYSEIELLGPTPAYPARLRGHYRWHVVLRGPEPRVLLDKIPIPQGWIIDVDPVALT